MTGKTNGAVRRQCTSWIDQFVSYTERLEAPEIFRRWSAITTVGAALEQKVWIQTSSILFPNMYTLLVGKPGIGKTRPINVAREFLGELSEFHIAPTSVTMASLVDALMEAKRAVVRPPDPTDEFNSLTFLSDEWSALMHEYNNELVAGLTTFWDCTVPYSQRRRTKELKVVIRRPQLSILGGSTPSNLLEVMPKGAWEQGFTSRLMLIHSDEPAPIQDIFDDIKITLPNEMIHDLRLINVLYGRMSIDDGFKAKYKTWREGNEPGRPIHPKLVHYCTRRRMHLLKLGMVASVDRGDSLELTGVDFDRAMLWLKEAESAMAGIFVGGSHADGKSLDEIYHFVQTKEKVREHQIIAYAHQHLSIFAAKTIIETMEKCGMIKMVSQDRLSGERTFKGLPR